MNYYILSLYCSVRPIFSSCFSVSLPVTVDIVGSSSQLGRQELCEGKVGLCILNQLLSMCVTSTVSTLLMVASLEGVETERNWYDTTVSSFIYI